MAKEKKESKVAKESKAVNVAEQVTRTFGSLAKEWQEVLASLPRYNKHALALLYHCLCAMLGVSRQVARTRINAMLGVIHAGTKPGEFTMEAFIAEAYKVDKAGNYKAGTLDSYSQLAKFDFYNGKAPQAITDKQRGDLAALLASDFAKALHERIKTDEVLGKTANKKAKWEDTQKQAVASIS